MILRNAFAQELISQVRDGIERNEPQWDPADVESMIDWAEHVGTSLRGAPVPLEAFRYVHSKLLAGEMFRVVVEGPRGGGKTQWAATVEAMAYHFFGWSWVNMGASKEQAYRCYDHLKEFHKASASLQQFSESCQATRTQSVLGNKIQVLAATETSFRGAHPSGVSPPAIASRQLLKGGGGCTIDEAAIVPDETIDDSKGVLSSANPSGLVQISTVGKRLGGRFYQLTKNPERYGYKRYAYDVFGVAKRCPYECDKNCPIPEHFAKDYGRPGAPDHHKAYCGGKAHETDGWIAVDEIAQLFTELPRAAFEREFMGIASADVGHVYREDLIDACVKEALNLKGGGLTSERFLRLEKSCGIDWGYAGQTCVVYVLRIKELRIPYRWLFFSRETYETIIEGVVDTCFRECVPEVLADSAEPAWNAYLRKRVRARWEELADQAETEGRDSMTVHSVRVTPVVFSKWKAFGIGVCVRLLERGLFAFVKSFLGRAVEGYGLAMEYLRGYRYDANGKPVKEDDHGPDAFLCANLRWEDKFRREKKPL